MASRVKRIFITGANGFIGEYLSKYLADKGCRITAVVRNIKWHYKNIEFIEGDLFDIEKFGLNKNQFDFVIHLAANLRMYEKGGLLYKYNFELTKCILNFFSGARVYFIYFSSIDAFGPTGESWVNEETSPNPVTDYGLAKLRTEKLVRETSRNFSILRAGNVYSKNKGIPNGIIEVFNYRNLLNFFQSFAFKNIIFNYELNLVAINDVCLSIYRIINLVPTKKMYFLTAGPIKIKEILKKNRITYCNMEFLLPLIILINKLFKLLNMPNLISYVVQGGFIKKYRRYSNEFISSDLKMKFKLYEA